MANEIFPANIFNPMVLWTDLGLRAADMTLASSQNLGEGVDRAARGGAGDQLEARSLDAAAALMTPLGLDLPARLHRTAFEFITNGWVQWMSTLGSVASFAAGLGGGGHSDALDAFRVSLLPGGGARPTTHARAQREHAQLRRETHAGNARMEHAAAAPAPRRRAASKGRRTGGSRASARNS